MAKFKFQSPKGMHDILPKDQKYWKYVLDKGTRLLEEYNFEKIDTPILEDANLFARSVGEGTDIVEKEMYTLKTKGGDFLALKPEGTSSVVRAYIENGLKSLPHPLKLYYFSPMFRHEQPQSGRFRQHHQLGVEVFGEEGPIADAEIILIAYKFLTGVGFKNLTVKINSIGDQYCRPQYIKALKEYFRPRLKKLCSVCAKGRYKTNTLRILDCAESKCREIAAEAPQIFDYLDQNCKNHFKMVLEFLDELGIPYLLEPTLVRGLDYYTKTVFEIFMEEDKGTEEKRLAMLSGGRYDKLVEILGGVKTPACGWGAGMERVILKIKEAGVSVPSKYDYARLNAKVFVAQLGDAGRKKGLWLFEKLREEKIKAVSSLGRDSIKSQLRIANRLGVAQTLIVGQKEALDGTVIVRDMKSGSQETVPLGKVADIIKKNK